MGHPAEKRDRATYADLAAVPAHLVAELVEGTLHVFPRPAPRHAMAESRVGARIGGPFDLGEGGPGGWRILIEPELHFADATAPKGENVLDPDVAGWRLERMPELPTTAYFELAPDWVCEVLSKSTEDFDRETKMPIYAREGVQHAWLLDPIARVLEVYTLGRRGWGKPTIYREAQRVRIAPFEAIEIDPSIFWAK
jgi:hypothetical protein